MKQRKSEVNEVEIEPRRFTHSKRISREDPPKVNSTAARLQMEQVTCHSHFPRDTIYTTYLTASGGFPQQVINTMLPQFNCYDHVGPC
ncbi:hypothetical protein EV356DRAFT_339142 [Viridothelium virens]|uniref:Uncharacterized protein n=1 Tax=Viridothelium virens TaxID=1048519 RepID=A0A6A6HK35_VIRVR|nr:hypothetical protein EV356DRAFT_339142 [Viridothelium virens]